MKNRIFIYFIILIIFSTLAYAENEILTKYIKIGINNNLALKQKKMDYEKSIKALKQARGMFFPDISFQARYTRAGGGREIVFPVGDMLNPIYRTLNNLLEAQNRHPSFPENVKNEVFPFLRPKEHDTKIRLIQPIFMPSIYFNYKIKKNIKNINRIQTLFYIRNLISEIKNSYYTHLKANKVLEIYKNSKLLLEENLRITKQLFEVGKVTEDVVFRAESEILKIEQKITEAEKNKKLTASYLNFILNRPLNKDVKISDDFHLQNNLITLENATKTALNKREEIKLLNNKIKSQENIIKLNKSSYLPSLTGVFDYGFQGTEYNFSDKYDYWSASLIMEWNLFKGFQKKFKLSQSKIEKRKTIVEKEKLNQNIKLQVKDSYESLKVAEKSILSAKKQLQAAEMSYDIIKKKYEYGTALQIEFIDAQNNFTNSRINLSIKKYDYLIKHAQFELISGIKNLDAYQSKVTGGKK